MKNQMKIYYDEEGDYLTIFVGDSKPNYGEEVSSGITIFKDEETDEIIGIGILNFRKKAKDLDEIELNLPFKINFSALKV
ncbi:MAG: DUF2283 domain-containing protein [Nanoarchaeota archaeon]